MVLRDIKRKPAYWCRVNGFETTKLTTDVWVFHWCSRSSSGTSGNEFIVPIYNGGRSSCENHRNWLSMYLAWRCQLRSHVWQDCSVSLPVSAQTQIILYLGYEEWSRMWNLLYVFRKQQIPIMWISIAIVKVTSSPYLVQCADVESN